MSMHVALADTMAQPQVRSSKLASDEVDGTPTLHASSQQIISATMWLRSIHFTTSYWASTRALRSCDAQPHQIIHCTFKHVNE